MNKKQTKALQDIAANLQYRKDAQLALEHEARAEKNEPPLPRHICGEQKTPTGYAVLDGYVGVYYHHPAAGLPHDDDYDEPADMLRREIEDQLENGGYYLVREPFGAEVSSSRIRDLLKEHSTSLLIEKGRKEICLTAYNEYGHEIKSRFNSIYVRRAVEAVGGKVCLYIGKHRTKRQPCPFLIVKQASDPFDLDHGIYAIVMPLNRR